MNRIGLLVAIVTMVSCTHAGGTKNDVVTFAARLTEVQRNGLVFTFAGDTHDYDIYRFRISASTSAEREFIDIAVPVKGSGVFERMNSTEKDRTIEFARVAQSGAGLVLGIEREDLERFREAKRRHSPLAFVYLADVDYHET